jgi:glycine/D-amino acid oxidase-like deaminating enzyme
MNKHVSPQKRKYDPKYDPLTGESIGVNTAYSPTYWVATAGEPPEDDGPVLADMEVDVVIVGSGATGLSTALYLAKEHGIKAVILEANQLAWGCSSRNGGQGQNASGRLSRSQWIKRWGLDTAKRLDAEIRLGFENFKELTREFDCEATDTGHLYVAHRVEKMDYLREEARVRRDIFGYKNAILSREEIKERYCDDHDAHGALLESEGVGIHPLKFNFGLMRKSRALGVRIHTSSPVLSSETQDGINILRTPGGVVRAKRVAFCTGGYAEQKIDYALKNKILPILSNSVVTRPLTPDELKATGFKSNIFITDTRTLRFYYRLLKDNRLQIGSRSSVSGRDAADPTHLKLLTDGIARKFPAIANIPIEYSWWGWVDVSHDMMPRIVRPDLSRPMWYALGYGGNGVSFSTWAGKRLAERIAGKDIDNPVFNLPIYAAPLEYPNLFGVIKSALLAPFRRIGQHILYKWYWLRDEKI